MAGWFATRFIMDLLRTSVIAGYYYYSLSCYCVRVFRHCFSHYLFFLRRQAYVEWGQSRRGPYVGWALSRRGPDFSNRWHVFIYFVYVYVIQSLCAFRQAKYGASPNGSKHMTKSNRNPLNIYSNWWKSDPELAQMLPKSTKFGPKGSFEHFGSWIPQKLVPGC